MATRRSKKVSDSRMYNADIIGEESLQGRRLQSGSVLTLVDMLAGRIAYKHSGAMSVTMAFDRVDFFVPILHQDLVRCEGRLVWVGSSSMLVEVQVYKQDLLARQFIPTTRCFITMVAVDEHGKPTKTVPALEYDGEEVLVQADIQARKRLQQECQRLEEEVDSHPTLWTLAEVEDPVNRSKSEYLAIAETELRVQRQFMPRHLNLYSKIFGGDILEWMDRVATYCARHFTRNPYMFSIAMYRVVFKKPLLASDLVEMKARVVYVCEYTLEVEIIVETESVDGERVHSHTGYFTVQSCDELGHRRPIATGLKLSEDDQDSLKAYEKGKRRYRVWASNRELEWDARRVSLSVTRTPSSEFYSIGNGRSTPTSTSSLLVSGLSAPSVTAPAATPIAVHPSDLSSSMSSITFSEPSPSPS